jgi:hypothetical protein
LSSLNFKHVARRPQRLQFRVVKPEQVMELLLLQRHDPKSMLRCCFPEQYGSGRAGGALRFRASNRRSSARV